ncbi:alpha/beta hydrolase [Nonomuraea endophytica]|uniref:Pimeloyl-ACP methyl ester carboxylesterase n=1 Tax=Nonomuraea endophytica TaxID=714136 RepID=A0A7W8EJG4_9ACTN|nr:alpha/beta hydrolase [Nonomuraea endophytica]MBB5081491.1 pimeloyl-ACP methyl ester carboxylesterase [Nonomuraea endophytica]
MTFPSPSRRRALLAACALAVLSTALNPVTANAAAPAISWGRCTSLPEPAKDLECGKLAVPLDHGAPGKGTIDLALIRAKATGERVGSMVFNFGGGGHDVLDFAARVPQYAALRTRYDLVSFDRRGSGGSVPLSCGSDRTADRFLALDPGIQGPAARTRFLRANAAFIRACEKESGRIMPHAGLANVAGDLDRVRAALGQDKLTYYGLSYGTILGGLYATKFPARVGRMVLDAGVSPDLSLQDVGALLSRISQEPYERFLAGCVKDGCELGRDAATADRTIRGWIQRLVRQPLKVGKRTLTAAQATNVLTLAAAPTLWGELESALVQAIRGKGSPVLEAADAVIGRAADGSYPPGSPFRAALADYATQCVDLPGRSTPAELARQEAGLTRRSPLFGPMRSPFAYSAVCSQWPVPYQPAGQTINYTGSAPILVITATNDAAAPPAGAARLARKLKNAVILTYEGDSHGSYPTGGPCVTNHVEDYLLRSKVPAPDASCPK